MTAEGHLIFSIACAVFAKNTDLIPAFVQGDWWHIVPSAMLTCLLPDIDHPKSLLGQRLRWISRPIALFLGHRGFTHSLLAVFIFLIFFYLKVLKSWIIPADVICGMILGYISHIIADMFTPNGVPLLWPCRWRFRLPMFVLQKGNNRLERILCIALLVYAIWMPENLSLDYVLNLISQVINFLKIYFNRLFKY